MFNTEDFKKSVLDRAMRGKLTKQLPEDGDAKDLLNQIDAEKKALINDGKIKAQKPLSEIAADEIPFEIPENWQWVRLGDIAKLINGRAYKQSELLNDSNLTPILRVGNMFTNNSWYYSDLNLPDDKYIDDGDLIYSWSASFGPAIWNGPHVIYHYHIWKIIPYGINKTFLYYLLMYITKNAKKNSHGTSMKHLTKSKMECTLVPITTLPEQKRIVENIDKCFDLANHIDQENSLTDKFNVDIRKSLLQSAMMGKLTKQLPEDGDASDLLDQIKSEKETLIKDKKIKAQKPLPEIDADEIPFDIPDNWRWVRLGEITSYIQRGKSPKYGDDGIKVLSQKCITWNGVDISKARKITKNSLEKYDDIRYLKPNDILWNSTGTGTLGRVSKVDSELINVEKSLVVDSHVTVIRVIHVVSKFILMYLLSPQIQGNLNKMSSGSTNQTELSKKAVENALIPLPPLSEQKRIVNKMDKLLDELKG